MLSLNKFLKIKSSAREKGFVETKLQNGSAGFYQVN
jgi:hypothetical protein